MLQVIFDIVSWVLAILSALILTAFFGAVILLGWFNIKFGDDDGTIERKLRK